MPTADGTSWRYNMTEEIGKGLKIPDAKPDADGKIRLRVLYRINGTENVEGKDLLKFEMHRAGVITNTDLLTVDDHGIVCRARINVDGELVKFDSPQTMIAAPLKKGASWDFNGKAGEASVRQHYEVVGEEDIRVPAGNFHAFRIYGEQTSPSRMTIDRWFAIGVGIVKDVTAMRAARAGRNAENHRSPRSEIRCTPEAALSEHCKGAIRKSDYDFFVKHVTDLRPLAGPTVAKRRKDQGRLDRREHRRGFSSRLQGGRSLRCRRKPDRARSVHADPT